MRHTLNLVALHLVYVPLCLGIVAAVVCRVDMMTKKRNRRSWLAMYAAMAVFALGELIDVLLSHQWMAAHELVGLVAIAANLLLTQKDWVHRPPPLSCRPGCEP